MRCGETPNPSSAQGRLCKQARSQALLVPALVARVYIVLRAIHAVRLRARPPVPTFFFCGEDIL